MYADRISPAMKATIDETERRRRIQDEYNKANGITPKTIEKSVRDVIEATRTAEDELDYDDRSPLEMTKKELADYVAALEKDSVLLP